VIPGQSSPEIYSSLARVVRTIGSAEILAMPAGTIQDILEHVTALDIRQRGSHGVQADVSMRGGSFEQVLILLNGVRINDPQTGHHNLNIPVNLPDIERIEILQGPGSRIYGPNAFSGAINIITREPGQAGISGSITGGEYGFIDLHGSGSFKTGPWAITFPSGILRPTDLPEIPISKHQPFITVPWQGPEPVYLTFRPDTWKRDLGPVISIPHSFPTSMKK
jgi:hypothetical protein